MSNILSLQQLEAEAIDDRTHASSASFICGRTGSGVSLFCAPK